jgi:hypothetical protein
MHASRLALERHATQGSFASFRNMVSTSALPPETDIARYENTP